MKLNEILLPPGTRSKDLSPKQERKIDMLQQRMSKYADMIGNPSTSNAARDFLKAKLKADLAELKSIIEMVNEDAMPVATTQYEVYDRKTGERVGGPYSTAKRARNVRDKKDLEYGAVRYGVRPVGNVNEAHPKQQLSIYNPDGKTYRGEPMPNLDDNDPVNNAERYGIEHDQPYELDINNIDNKKIIDNVLLRLPSRLQEIIKMSYYDGMSDAEIGRHIGVGRERIRQLKIRAEKTLHRILSNEYRFQPISEAITKLPLTDKDFDLVKELMSHPIPAAIAPIYVEQILEDDEFTAELATLEDTEPGRDVRPLIAEWFKRVMPDQLYRFVDNRPSHRQRLGELSPIHGYNDNQHRGSNNPIVGNNYGSF